MSERADLIAAKERLTKSAAISTMATSGRSRSYDGHQMQMVRLEDLRLLLASGEGQERAERIQRARDILREHIERLDNLASLKRLSFAEQYREGNLRVFVKFESRSGLDLEQPDLWAVGKHQGGVYQRSEDASALVAHHQSVDFIRPVCGNEDVMLVSNVEQMQPVQVELPSRVGLYLIPDEGDYLSGGGIRYLSFDGTQKRLPVTAKGKAGVLGDAAAVGFHQDTVRVIEGGPEVVNRIAQDAGTVLGEAHANDLPHVIVGLSQESFFVFSGEGPEHRFKVANVYIGPFGL